MLNFVARSIVDIEQQKSFDILNDIFKTEINLFEAGLHFPGAVSITRPVYFSHKEGDYLRVIIHTDYIAGYSFDTQELNVCFTVAPRVEYGTNTIYITTNTAGLCRLGLTYYLLNNPGKSPGKVIYNRILAFVQEFVQDHYAGV